MKLGKPIYWHQGLFLQPQHLQYLDENNMALINSLLQVNRSYAWGFASLNINRQALASGVLECVSFNCALKDGTFLSFPNNCVLASRSFDKAWPDKSKPLKVYLGLKRESRQETNVSVVANGDPGKKISTRYVSDVNGENYLDRYDGGNETPLKQLSFATRLYFESELEQLDDVELLPITALSQSGGQIHLDAGFIPPLLCLHASPVLRNQLDALKNNLQGRAVMLESYAATSGIDTGSAVNATKNKMALQALAGFIPRLSSQLEQAAVEPVQIYGLLREIAGQLSIFSEHYAINGESNTAEHASLMDYDHADLGAVFDRAINVIGVMLNELTIGPELLVNLNQVESGKFVGSLGRDYFRHKNTVYLVLRSASKLKDQIPAFMDYSKLGSAGQVEVYARRSLPGVNMLPIDGKPLGVSAQPNAYYFAIERQGHEWGYVEDTNQISLIWDAAPEDLCVDILSVRG